ncbi:MAG: hypothetical protein AAB664_00750 [Patescibacteria group bacterium]
MHTKNFIKAFFVIVVLFVVCIWGYVQFTKKPVHVSSPSKQEEPMSDWKTYTSTAYHFSLKHPPTWTITEYPDAEKTGRIVDFQSPETMKLLQEKKIDPGYSHDVVMFFWPNINNEYARGGSWIGQRTYANLEDFFTDKQSFKQKTGTIELAGQRAYEISSGGNGLNFGVMLEHDGVYELSFETAWDKTKLTTEQKQILSTFTLLKRPLKK